MATDYLLRIRGRSRRVISHLFARRIVRLKGHAPVISFSFDDFPKLSLSIGASILEKYGCRATFYASLGLADRNTAAGRMFSKEDLAEAVQRGHEIGCHTYSHCHSWDTRADLFENSSIENGLALLSVIPGISFRTMSYPISCPRPSSKRRMGRRFACCRGGGQTFNSALVDLNYVRAFFLEKSTNDPLSVKAMIRRCCMLSGWLIFVTHDVCDYPTPFGCSTRFFETIVQSAAESGANIVPVGKALDALGVIRNTDTISS